MNALSFRNVDASPSDQVSEWPLEAIQTALERGGLSHWRQMSEAIRAQPWGKTARSIEEILTHSRPYGVAEAMERVISLARQDAAAAERQAVAEEVSQLIQISRLSRTEFASRIGTSASRLSTYATGKVTPSATLLLRMRRLVDTERERAGRDLLAMPPPRGPEPDWEDQKQEMLDAPMRKWKGA